MSLDPAPVLTLVLATYGRAEVMAPLVQSLLAQVGPGGTAAPSFEVVVADQNPDDRVLPLIEPLRAAGRLGAHLRLGEPNLSKARNAGIAAARGRLVVFPDDDCWYHCETLARAAAEFAADPALDGIAARWVEAGPERGDDRPVITRDAMRQFRGGNVASITLFLRLDAVRAAGGFDDRIGVGRWYGAGEETDLVFSLLEHGCRLTHAAAVMVHHHVTAPQVQRPIAIAFTQERRRARGTGAMYAKHRLPVWVVLRGLLAPLLVVPGTDLAADLAAGAGKTVGRIEGLVRWQLEERRSRTRSAPLHIDKDDRTT